MMAKTRAVTSLAAMMMILAVSAVPAQADPPVRSEEPIFFIFPDVENGLVVFWNTTRDGFCDWVDGGFVGPEPVVKLVTATIRETGKGALVGSFHADRHLEVWRFDDDADLSGPCLDTDEQVGAWAIGSATVTGNDNDFGVSGTRVNSFGDRGQGSVVADDGSRWHYSFASRILIDRDGVERPVVERTNLKKQGN